MEEHAARVKAREEALGERERRHVEREEALDRQMAEVRAAKDAAYGKVQRKRAELERITKEIETAM